MLSADRLQFPLTLQQHSDILINAAIIAYGREPDYVRLAPGQPDMDELILSAFTGPLATRKRKVRPRFSMLPQPVDESETLGEGRDKEAGSGSAPQFTQQTLAIAQDRQSKL